VIKAKWPDMLLRKNSGGNIVKNMLFAAALIAALIPMAAAQDSRMTPPGSVVYAYRGSAQVKPSHVPAGVPFCPTKTCLYYAGEFDSTNSLANGLLNELNPGIGLNSPGSQVFQAVKPSANSTITGSGLVELSTNATVGTNPTPFSIRTGMATGKGGKIVCNTKGTAVEKAYGEGDFGFNSYSYVVKKLKKSCKVTKGKTYYVNLLPSYNDGSTISYESDVEDAKPANHKGWKNLIDKSFFNFPAGGVTFQNTQAYCQSVGAPGCDLFDVALTGTKP
jgi:hypothetical protein